MSSDKTAIPRFSHGEVGLTRFPPNVEAISVRHDLTVSWMSMRRNDTELRFPLYPEDCEHLAKLLLERGSGPVEA